MYMLVRGRWERSAKIDRRWRKGIFAGIQKGSDEAVVMTPEGPRKARSIRIVVEEQRYDWKLVNQAVGVPWDDEGDGLGGEPSVILPAGVDARPVHDARITPPEAAESRPFAHKRVCITNDALMKFRYTTGCRARESARRGRRAPRVPHTPECRARLEEAMARDERHSERLTQTETKLTSTSTPPVTGAATVTRKNQSEEDAGNKRHGPARMGMHDGDDVESDRKESQQSGGQAPSAKQPCTNAAG